MNPPGLAAILALTITACVAQQATVVVDGAAKGIPLPSTLHGIFFEELNRSGDGGLYAEMLANRSFEEHRDQAVDWKIEGKAALDREGPLHPNNPTHLRIDGAATLTAAGFKERGFRVDPREPLKLSFWTRTTDTVKVEATLFAQNGKSLAAASSDLTNTEWARHEIALKPVAADSDTRLVLRFTGPLRLDMVSLMPAEGWRGLPFRKDLAELLAAMKPGHIRFPGGCYVEGETMAFAHRWKDTIGPIEQRPMQAMRWGYHGTGGFGVLEFLQWCEVLDAEPIYVLNAGMSHQEDVPLDRMGPFIQDAVDFMEYATGGPGTEWGSKRIAHGRKEPFRIRFLEIGNENGGIAYEQRYELFHDALKARWPDLQIIANEWDRRVPLTRKLDLIDEHYYRPSTWFRQASRKYEDPALRNGPRIYVGEYASSHDSKAGTLRGALGDASFLTAIPGASFAGLRITTPDGRLLAGGPDTRWGLAGDEFRLEGETFTRTTTRPRDLPAPRQQRSHTPRHAHRPRNGETRRYGGRLDSQLQGPRGEQYRGSAGCRHAEAAALGKRHPPPQPHRSALLAQHRPDPARTMIAARPSLIFRRNKRCAWRLIRTGSPHDHPD